MNSSFVAEMLALHSSHHKYLTGAVTRHEELASRTEASAGASALFVLARTGTATVVLVAAKLDFRKAVSVWRLRAGITSQDLTDLSQSASE